MSQSGDLERKKITGRAGVVALGTLFSRILGLARDMVLAAAFSRAATDAWLIAWQIPNVLRQILAEGAVQTAVLPVLSEVREKEGEEEAQRYFRAMRGLSVCALLLTSLLGMLFAPALVRLFASGFEGQDGQFERTVELTRWVFPYVFFMGTCALGLAALNAHRRFVVTSFAPALLNVGFLVAAFVLPGFLGAHGHQEILAMALGGLAGGVMQMVAQWPSLKKIGYLTLPRFDFSHPMVRETLRRLAPTLLGIGVYFIDVMIGRRLLSELPEGSVTYFSYALRLCDFSQGIFVMALSAATLPSLATFAAKGDLEELGRTLAYSLRLALFVGAAATALSLALAEPMVATIFERGHFKSVDTHETARAYMAQGAGIFLVAGVRQLVLVFFALGKTKIPVYVAVIDLIVFAAVGLGLRDTFGHVGISFAVTAARITQFSLLWLALGRILPRRPSAQVFGSFAKSAAAATLAGLFTYFLYPSLGAPLGWVPFPLLAATGTACIAYLFVFVACARALGSEELAALAGPLVRRLKKKA